MEHYNPSTLDELVDILDKIVSPVTQDDLRKMDDDQLLGELSILKPFIMNNLIFDNGNCISLYTDCGLKTPKDVARLAIWLLWHRLRHG